MITEHWTNEDRTEHSLTPLAMGFFARGLLTKGTPVKCCEIEAATWEECCKAYDQHISDAQKEIRPKADEGAD